MSNGNNNRGRWLVWAVGLALVLGTAACYWPVRHFDYVNLDDSLYVYENQTVERGLTWAGAVWAFHSIEGGNWNPLVWLSHMLDCQIYGATAGGHHATNVILHITNVLLLFLVLRRMTGTLWRSGLTAALFAWHPSHVESVAWISERKDVLSTLFWLLTMRAYARYAQEFKIKNAKSKIYYSLALGFFALGLMSKPMLVTLPVVLLLMDFWPLKRITKEGNIERPTSKIQRRMSEAISVSWKRALVEKVPFLILSAAVSAVTVWAQQHAQAVGEQGLILRLENAVVSYVKYVGEFLWPVKLAVFYPYPETIPAWQVSGAVAILGVMTVGIIWAGSKRPYLTTGWLWFLVTLLPVIGLVQVGKQALADRYTYVPYIGPGMIISWGLADLASFGLRYRVTAVSVAMAGLAGCVAVTLRQVTYWQNGMTLFGHAAQVTSENDLVENKLGILLLRQGKLDDALKHLKEALRLNPQRADSYYNLSMIYLAEHRPDLALASGKEALRLTPESPECLNGVAWIYATSPKAEFRNGMEAVRLAEEACALTKRQNPDLLDTLAAAYAETGRFDAAIKAAEEARALTDAAHNPETAKQISERLKLYQAGNPYHDKP